MKQCDTPPNIDNAEKRVIQSGYKVSYTCNSGYDLANPSYQTLVCRDGAWIGTWPTCGKFISFTIFGCKMIFFPLARMTLNI